MSRIKNLFLNLWHTKIRILGGEKMILKEILKKNNIKNSDVSRILDIKSLSTISLKINGKSQITVLEAKKLKKAINEKSEKQYTLDELFD